MTDVKVDTRAFVQMTRELARRAGVPDETALVAEVGKVLEGAIRNTKAGSKAKIASRFKNATFSAQPASMYSPKSGRSGVTTTKGGFIPYFLRNRYPDALWSAMTERRNKSFFAKVAAIGLSKKSWYEIGRRLGLTLKGGTFVKAIASTGKEYPENTATKIERQKSRLQVSIFNSQPTVNATGGERALQAAIDGRAKFFLANIALKTFEKAANVAKQYPGIRITR